MRFKIYLQHYISQYPSILVYMYYNLTSPHQLDVINPDVLFLSNDIYQRKMQNTKLEKERSDNNKFKKQTNERIRELEVLLVH